MAILTWMSIFAGVLCVFGSQPDVKCPAPVSPLNGQLSLTETGISVKYSCNPGFELKGTEISICKDNQWFPEAPICELIQDEKPQDADLDEVEPEMPFATPRPLFKWDADDEEEEIEEKIEAPLKDESNDTMQSDEARIRRVVYPRRRVVTTTPIKVRSSSTLDEEERKRELEKSGTQSPSLPSFLYVRRPSSPGKSWSYPYRAPHQVVVNREDNRQVVVNREDNRQVDEETLRYYHWGSQYPRRSLVDYRNGIPVGLRLSESQLTWINSLHPELRERYLRDLYEVRANEVSYLTHPDDYTLAYNNPYYVRQPSTVVAENHVSTLDYSCHRTERDGRVVTVRAPKLPNAAVYKYDRRQNPIYPRNDYLVAQYRCKRGYKLLDAKSNELFCSQSAWVGNPPICVPKF